MNVADSAVVRAQAESVSTWNRMAVALLALVGVFIAAYMLFVKLGWIGTLVCGEGGECDTVQASSWAVFLGVPVPAWGVIGYGFILAVALIGIQPRWVDDERISLALVALATIAFVFSMYLTALEAFVIQAWCRWCVVSAAIATGIFLCTLPELRRRSDTHHAPQSNPTR